MVILALYAANRPKNESFLTPKPRFSKISWVPPQGLDQNELLVLEISTKNGQNFRKVMEKGTLKTLGPPKTMDLTILACQHQIQRYYLALAMFYVCILF